MQFTSLHTHRISQPILLCVRRAVHFHCQFLCKLHQTLSLLIILDHLYPVVQAAVESVCKGPLDDGLLEEESNKRGLEMLILELPETFEDTSDAEVVVRGAVQVSETRLPVIGSFKFPYRNVNGLLTLAVN